jgi:hypothetical protein
VERGDLARRKCGRTDRKLGMIDRNEGEYRQQMVMRTGNRGGKTSRGGG